MRRLETEEQAPLSTTQEALESAPSRTLREVGVEPVRRTLAAGSDLTAGKVVTTLPARRPRRPALRVLEEALNGGDSAHEPWADAFETLAIGLAAGLTEPEALRGAARRTSPRVSALFAEAAQQAERGVPLHITLMRHPEVPPVLGPLLEYGSRYGTLESASRRVTAVMRRFSEIDRRFAYSTVRPEIVPILAICALLPFMPYVVGLFTTSALPFFVIVVAVALAAYGIWTRRDQMALRQPKTLRKARRALRNTRAGLQNRALVTARWCRTVCALVDAGVPISAALESGALAARNAHHAAALRQAAVLTREGRSLHDSLAETALLPARLLEVIRTAEISGDTALLDRFADLMDDDARMLAAQRFARLVIMARLFVACVLVVLLTTALGAGLGRAISGAVVLFLVGALVIWLLFLTQARNDL